jgi:hypothetical protein
MGANNQGIIHISFKQGGEPLCRNRRAHMSTTADRIEADSWSRVCIKCGLRYEKAKAVSARNAARAAAM